jgi:hypothetical protein
MVGLGDRLIVDPTSRLVAMYRALRTSDAAMKTGGAIPGSGRIRMAAGLVVQNDVDGDTAGDRTGTRVAGHRSGHDMPLA